ncbi:hypothetical protein UA08_02509 [Talaromyces atroroseus]|uniref:O-methyltransferase C-terminal domain-containing protein n=1 Tax=Talaromyces atroroseus TaxID=1441469 RepID=A0A225AK21_TALAT|nr:hypothetical protein UA08_02509 [Talaromyces atroroseus]OKL61872.1 hypothetical protein UA08_02509 [Talaromyces atroroseus]
MTCTTKITELSTSISRNVAKINRFNEENDLPTQSFEPNAPTTYDYPPDIEEARQAVLLATDELHALMAGPANALMAPSHNVQTSIHAMYRFKIANSFPEGKEEVTYTELATACGLTGPTLLRIVRDLMAHRIFRQTPDGKIAHTSASKLFANNHAIRQWVGMVLEEMWPAATKVVDALQKWPNSEEPNQSGFNLAHNVDQPMLEFLGKEPERAKRFAEAMSLFNTSPGMETKYIVEHYNWTSSVNDPVTVVDVGGSHGDVAISLACKYQNVTCIVQDLPEVIASAKIPEGLEKRLRFMEYDFFTEQPVKNADVYLFKWILHDWSDKYCIKILRSLIPALKQGARVVVNELILPEPETVPLNQEATLRSFDIAMWEIQNGKERDSSDWESLFQAVDYRLRLTKVIQPRGSKLGIIEATWDTCEALKLAHSALPAFHDHEIAI